MNFFKKLCAYVIGGIIAVTVMCSIYNTCFDIPKNKIFLIKDDKTFSYDAKTYKISPNGIEHVKTKSAVHINSNIGIIYNNNYTISKYRAKELADSGFNVLSMLLTLNQGNVDLYWDSRIYGYDKFIEYNEYVIYNKNTYAVVAVVKPLKLRHSNVYIYQKDNIADTFGIIGIFLLHIALVILISELILKYFKYTSLLFLLKRINPKFYYNRKVFIEIRKLTNSNGIEYYAMFVKRFVYYVQYTQFNTIDIDCIYEYKKNYLLRLEKIRERLNKNNVIISYNDDSYVSQEEYIKHLENQVLTLSSSKKNYET